MRYAQLVMGPAGSGKSTYCSTLVSHAQDAKRTVNVVNLDPASEYFSYQPVADIRQDFLFFILETIFQCCVVREVFRWGV